MQQLDGNGRAVCVLGLHYSAIQLYPPSDDEMRDLVNDGMVDDAIAEMFVATTLKLRSI